MECLKTFTVTVSGSQNVVAPEANFWGLAPENYWNSELGFGTTSRFNIQGFKNINIYKVKAVGSVQSTINSTNLGIVQDWTFYIKIGGNIQNIGGFVRAAPNKFSMTIENLNPNFLLDKYNRCIEFQDPITSCSFFEVLGLTAQGIGAQSLGTINLNWNITFVIYYKFEGEEFALL